MTDRSARSCGEREREMERRGQEEVRRTKVGRTPKELPASMSKHWYIST